MNTESLIGTIRSDSLLGSLFDEVRLIDPDKKMMCVCESKVRSAGTSGDCFSFLGRTEPCSNCIAQEAVDKARTFTKLENIGDKTYLLMALPYEVEDGDELVVEFVKEVTGDLSLAPGDDGSAVLSFADQMNSPSCRDSLTGLYNRRYVDGKLPIDMTNTALLGQALSVMLVDIDGFTQINETYGDVIGDQVLKSFSATISHCFRRVSDWVARFENDEFIICMPGAGVDVALMMAEKMRKGIEEIAVSAGEDTVTVTASFGVFCTTKRSSKDVAQALDEADLMLYKARRNGGNRVESVKH